MKEMVVGGKEAWERGRRVWAGLESDGSGCETAKIGTAARAGRHCGLRVPCTAKDTLTLNLHLTLPAMAGFFESLFLAFTLALSLAVSLGITVPLTGALVRLRGQ